MLDEVTDEQAQDAKAVLRAAITEYYSIVQPGAYVSDWALVTHKETIEMEQSGESSVGLLAPTGQGFHVTRGLLEIALDSQRGSARVVE